MWYATFLYNIEYAIHSQPNAVTDTHFPLIYLPYTTYPFYQYYYQALWLSTVMQEKNNLYLGIYSNLYYMLDY